MRSNSADAPKVVAGWAVEVSRLFAALLSEVTERGANARSLLEVAFDHAGGKIEVVMRSQPVPGHYPELVTVLGEIARTCASEGIQAGQLRRIVFQEDEIQLDVVDAWGEPQCYDYVFRPLVVH